MSKDVVEVMQVHDISETRFIIEWENGLRVLGTINAISETDNGFEENEDGYVEYYACFFKILQVLSEANEFPVTGVPVFADSNIEISMLIPPKRVVLENGQVIWSAH